MQVRHCPECDTEFLAHVERCSDCGGPLVDRVESEDGAEPSEFDAAEAPASTRTGLPPGEYVPLVQRDTAGALDPLAERLAGAGLPYRVEVRTGYGFELRVRREEHDTALVALNDLLGPRDSAPDEFDGESGAYTQCPACEAALPPGARECPECELLLEAKAPHCASCGEELDEATSRCLRCEGQPAE